MIFGINLNDDVWKSKMAGERFQYCTDSSGQQDNVLIPNNFFEYIHHIGCAVSLHSITNSGLVAGGQNSSRERQTVFFTAVSPMIKNHKDPYEIDLTKPRLLWYTQKKWKRHQDTAYWVEKQLAQRKGLKFYQTRCNAIILYDTPPAYCISKVVVMASGEIMYEKVFVSPRPPPKISYKDNWMFDLNSDVAGSSKDTQRIQPKPNYPIRRDPYVGKSPQRKSRNVLCSITRTSSTQQERGDPKVDLNPQKVAC